MNQPGFIDAFSQSFSPGITNTALPLIEMQNPKLTMLRRLWSRVMSTDDVLAELSTRMALGA